MLAVVHFYCYCYTETSPRKTKEASGSRYSTKCRGTSNNQISHPRIPPINSTIKYIFICSTIAKESIKMKKILTKFSRESRNPSINFTTKFTAKEDTTLKPSQILAGTETSVNYSEPIKQSSFKKIFFKQILFEVIMNSTASLT